ncbi:Trp biosynthesis-associated membrane protein [Brevibacterium sp. 91QC2O2]|uniref:Trp biosynthesis-associated membrane protein n=1 Tax=Brevibacterium TaxID=1696 RepID=UPI00211CC3B0|nr:MULTISPECIES: Trp biosynthesis-associated membrane protein [unclassified Brevibacterium]MCQ9366863.1 Trp biosynthesis-associated membrane protein [Brevibacterium sp. 91QC2O2]MCQ9384013.1 Trp biosynthesis-associated membrane protein [Brevibacterium sp. 68QC2CO]
MTKGRGVLALLVAAGLMWIVASRPWTPAVVDNAQTIAGVAGTSTSQAGTSPLLIACAAIVAVCALLLALLRGFGRQVMGVLAGLAGLGFAAEAIAVLAASGATAWPWAGLVLGLLTAGTAGWVCAAARTWKTSSRYERTTVGSDPDDPAATWDALSRGDDPSERD